MAHKRKAFHVYRRGNGVYYVRVPDKTYASGYRHESLGVTNERDAYRAAEALAGKKTDGGKHTFHEAALEFARLHFPELSQKSRERYDSSYKMVQPYLGAHTLDDIGTARLAEFVAARRQKVTDRTIRRDLMFISSVFNQAAVWEWTERNPVADYMRKQGRRSPLKRKVARKRYMSHDEEARLVKATEAYLAQPGHRSQAHERLMGVAAIFVSLDQGLRMGELRALQRAHIDRTKGAHGELFVDRCEEPDEEGPVKSEPRHIPLFARARQWLDKLPAHAEAPWVFWHSQGEKYGQLRQVLLKLCGLAGIKGLTWHDLRRTCGCRRLQDDRWPIERVSQFLGHQDVATTRHSYAFLDVQHLHAEMERGNAPSDA